MMQIKCCLLLDGHITIISLSCREMEELWKQNIEAVDFVLNSTKPSKINNWCIFKRLRKFNPIV